MDAMTREQRLAGIRERAEKAGMQRLHSLKQSHLGFEQMTELMAAFADSERERVLLEAAKAQCSLCAGKHPNYSPKVITSKEYRGIFHVALDAKSDRERDVTMARCNAARIHDLRSKGDIR